MTLTAALTDAAAQLGRAGESASSARLDRCREGLSDPRVRAVLFGEFNRGKSTLINALLGRVVLPAKLVPTTGHVTEVMHGDAEEVRVRHIDGRTAVCPLDRLGSFAALDDAGRARDEVERIVVAANCPLLADGLALIDTPGVCDHRSQTRRATDAVAEADIVLLVLDARQMLGVAEREYAADWMSGELGKPVTPVLNFAAAVPPAERAELRLILDRWCAARLQSALGRPWYEVDALPALRHALGGGPPPDDGFAALAAALRGLRGYVGRAVQTSSRRAQVLAEVRSARAGNRRALDGLRKDADRVARERADTRAGLVDAARRLDALAPLERQRLVAGVGAEFAAGRGNLLAKMSQHPGKSELEAGMTAWYADEIKGAARAAEKAVFAALLELAGEWYDRPEPLTVVEELVLQDRITVDDGAIRDAWLDALRRHAAAGAKTGSVLIPVVGTLAGGVIGGVRGLLASRWSHHLTVCRTAAETRWRADESRVSAALLSQFDARVDGFGRLSAAKLASSSAPIPPGGLEHREEADRALALCERLAG